MTTSSNSQSWSHVASLRPRLKSNAKINRQRFRGELWYVLQDNASGRYHRFSPAANQFIGMMDGRHTVQEIWNLAEQRMGEDVPSQDDVVRLLAQLHGADVLHADVSPDLDELSERQATFRHNTLLQTFRSPLAIRFPLLDPDRLLGATLGWVQPLFSWFGFALWFIVVATGVILAGMHWTDLTKDITDRVLSLDNLLVLFFVFPVVKAFHEMAHGYATKVWGGEVHEMGIMLLVLMPIPYVDASAASAFRIKRRRMVVGAAGLIIETFVASLAMIIWINIEPGLVRAIAYNVMLIAGVSTIIFNGNPLLRFDGYYIFADWLEIPNLGARSTTYLGYLIKRNLFGVQEAPTPVKSSERGWLIFYAISSFIYRMFVMVGIVMFVATKFFFIGVVMAVWAGILMFVWPIMKNAAFLISSPRLKEHRVRALSVTGLVLGILGSALFLAPTPYGTIAEGVIWVPDHAKVSAATNGFIASILVPSSDHVEVGTPLIEMKDPIHLARVRVLEAQLKEFEVRYSAERVRDRVEAAITGERIKQTKERLLNAREHVINLIIRSPAEGVFLLPRPYDLTDRFVRKGELLGYVINFKRPTVRVVVPQSDIDLVRRRTKRVDIRLAERIAEVIPATITREVPAALDRLPSVALGTAGGGVIAIDPSGKGGDKALQKVFQFELALPKTARVMQVGGRVFVRFDHGREPLAWQVYRVIRQMFLSKFNV